MDQTGRREFWASLAIRHCRGLGVRSRARLLNTFGSAYPLRPKMTWVHAGLSRRQARELGGESWRVDAMEEWERVRKLDDKILLWTDPRYPQRLRELPDAPVLLYCRGDPACCNHPRLPLSVHIAQLLTDAQWRHIWRDVLRPPA
ncbi:hypothetical protein [Candidatus Desulfovibrio trichonymphae]|uniref:hypothetical protein n=1 Tax=Candidatus Desulfovibrio trichonymphae TaxID=1725232 RepID=UPI001E59A977|nr:hypothetical protein [Candidatus Desulfovibrio trichonymphae]GHU99624.1 hypothetical protein AGMMS50248_08000 [Deltaproteobacteria bacterium]